MNYQLAAATRTQKGERVRQTGKLPAIVYGADGKPVSISLNYSEFLKLYKAAGASTLVDLALDSKEVGKVIIQDVQLDPVSDGILHVDLKRIDMNKKMRAPVELKFVGEAPIIKASGGTMVTSVDTVEVECLPKDLVSHIDVTIANLNTYDDVIKVKDLTLPAGIKIVSPNPEDLVAKAAPALTEEQIKAMEEAATAAVDLSKIESAKPKKEEEGEAAAEEGKAEPAKKEEKKEEKK